MTRQRKVILEALQGLRSHPTADQVYQIVRRRLPRISLGTVYRNLDTLASVGLIRDIRLGGSPRRFDGMIDPHYHVRCLRCGRVDDAPVKPIRSIERAARRASDYEMVGHRLEFIGLCPRCGKTAPSTHHKARTTGRKGRTAWT